MEMTFRWFGLADPVPLAHVRQIPGVRGVVSALHDVPVGDAWPRERLEQLAETIDAWITTTSAAAQPAQESRRTGVPASPPDSARALKSES